jgi:hypothetical protein
MTMIVALLVPAFVYAEVLPTTGEVAPTQVSTPVVLPMTYTLESATAALMKDNVSIKLAQLAIDAAVINTTSAGRTADKLKLLEEYGISSANTMYAEKGVLDKAAELELMVAEKTKVATEVGLKISLQESFYGILSAQENLKIKERSAARMLELYNTSVKKFQLGLVSKNALNSTKVDYDASLSAVITAKRDLDYKKMVFNQTMNLPLQTPFELSGALVFTPIADVKLEEKIAYGKANRLDVLAAKEGKDIKNITFAVDQLYYSPITFLYRTSSINSQKADYQYEQALVTAELSVRKAYNDLKAAEQGYLDLQKSVALVKEGYEIAKSMYAVGMNTQVDVTQALIQYNTMENNLNSALLGYKLAEMAFEASYMIGLGK